MVGSYLMASIIGAITPFCRCSSIPMLRGLLKVKAGFDPTMTFLFSSPLLNPIIIGLFLATFGMKVTIAYAAIALIVSVVAGLFLDVLNFEKYVIPEKRHASTSCCGSQPETQQSCCSAESKKTVKALVPIMLARKELQSDTLCCASTTPAVSASYSALYEAPAIETSCCSNISSATSCCSSFKPVPTVFSQ